MVSGYGRRLGPGGLEALRSPLGGHPPEALGYVIRAHFLGQCTALIVKEITIRC